MIFTLINSINKACRGRIYTHDYIGLIKKKKKTEGVRRHGGITKREEEMQAGNRRPGGNKQTLMEGSRDSSGIT